MIEIWVMELTVRSSPHVPRSETHARRSGECAVMVFCCRCASAFCLSWAVCFTAPELIVLWFYAECYAVVMAVSK